MKRVAIVGGKPFNIPPDFRDQFEVVFHQHQDRGRLRSIPNNTDFVLILKDFCSHSLYDSAKAEAGSRGIRYVTSRNGKGNIIEALKSAGIEWKEPIIEISTPNTSTNQIIGTINRAFQKGQAISLADITKELGEFHYANASNILLRMRQRGLVKRVGEGTYKPLEKIPFSTRSWGGGKKKPAQSSTSISTSPVQTEVNAKPIQSIESSPSTLEEESIFKRGQDLQDLCLDLGVKIQTFVQEIDLKMKELKDLQQQIKELETIKSLVKTLKENI